MVDSDDNCIYIASQFIVIDPKNKQIRLLDIVLKC